MQPLQNLYPVSFSAGCCVAVVLESQTRQNHVAVALDTADGRVETHACLTQSVTGAPMPGDKVLTISDQFDNMYVIGILPQQSPPGKTDKITLADGAYASLEKTESGEKLCFYSRTDALILEYDGTTGNARISPEGINLSFHAPNGDIDFSAAKSIRLNGSRLELSGRFGVGILAGQAFDHLKSAISMKPGKIDVSGENLRVASKKTDFFSEEVGSHVKKLVSRIGDARLVAKKLETIAETVIENAKTAYRTTEGLSRYKAGRIRMLIDSTFHVKSGSTIIKSEDDVKVKAEKIHLG